MERSKLSAKQTGGSLNLKQQIEWPQSAIDCPSQPQASELSLRGCGGSRDAYSSCRGGTVALFTIEHSPLFLDKECTLGFVETEELAFIIVVLCTGTPCASSSGGPQQNPMPRHLQQRTDHGAELHVLRG